MNEKLNVFVEEKRLLKFLNSTVLLHVYSGFGNHSQMMSFGYENISGITKASPKLKSDEKGL